MASTGPGTPLHLVALMAVLSCLSLASPSSRAQPADYGTRSDDRETILGGPGGSPFNLTCPAHTYLNGVTVHSGAWVNSIVAECRYPVRDKSGFEQGNPATTPAAGGHGGDAGRRAACALNQFVGSIKFGFTRDGNKPKYVDYVQLDCRPILRSGNASTLCLDTGGNGCWDKHPSPGPYNGFGLAFISRCPLGQWGKGIRGRSGDFVDALALTCEGAPR